MNSSFIADAGNCDNFKEMLKTQLETITPQLSLTVYQNASKLVEMLDSKILPHSWICASEDGATLQWVGMSIFCEFFNQEPEVSEEPLMYANVFNSPTEKEARIENSLSSNSVQQVCEFLNEQVSLRLK